VSPALRRAYLWLFGLLLVAVAVASLLPLNATPGLAVNDKLQHFLAYTGLALVGALATTRQWPLWWLGLALLLFGVVIELLQGYFGYRFAEWLDVVANASGIAAGLVLFALCRRLS
jgi:VanZ family protein